MMRTNVLTLCATCIVCGMAIADERATPTGTTWQGAVSLGAELDEHGLPSDGKAPAETPARIRVGFTANWSFSLHWNRIEPADGKAHAPAFELSPDESKIIELTNAERKKLKLPALQADPALMKLARAHSATMARLDKIGHDLEGKTFSQRMEQAKYQAARAGENVAQGQCTPTEAVAGWMQSPGHKANILQSDYTRIGVGMATSKSGKPYFTQVFAKPFAPSK